MDTEALVDELKDDGQMLVEELLQGGFEVTAALWLQASENGKWYFYIVSPVVDVEGTNKAYRRLHPLVYAIPLSRLSPLEIKLIGPSNPIARDVMAIPRRIPGPRVGPTWWSGRQLGNISIEGAFLYPMPVTTP